MEKLSAENVDLREKVKKIKEKVEVLTGKNEDMMHHLLKAHATKSERLTMLFRKLSYTPPGPSS